MAGETGEVFTRLTPILPVSSVRDELNFYQQLGFDQFSQNSSPTQRRPVGAGRLQPTLQRRLEGPEEGPYRHSKSN